LESRRSLSPCYICPRQGANKFAHSKIFFGVRVACHRFVSVFQSLVSNGFCVPVVNGGLEVRLLPEYATTDTIKWAVLPLAIKRASACPYHHKPAIR
jgi:hypothetical protein